MTAEYNRAGLKMEQTLRIVLVLGFLAVLPVALYYRLKSQASGEKLDRREEGTFILLTLRPIAAAHLFGMLAWILDPRWMDWSSVALPGWVRWAALALGPLTAAILLWTFRSLGKNLTDTVVTRREHELITSGPFRWVRHPLYVATFLAVTMGSLVTANWFLALTGGLVFLLLAIRVRREERLLLDRFGERYREYMERTWRFVPRI